jgi:radical SAM protein with 4Fe4S-binding SPASM domain
MTNNIKINKVEIQNLPLWDKFKHKKTRTPLSFEMEITARCNMNCRHCYINLPPEDAVGKNQEMTVSQIMDITEQAVEMGAFWCLITGGEPLLREDFFEIYLGMKSQGLLVSVFTNATLINDQHIEFFAKYPPRDIEVTVYGVTRDTYEKVTGQRGSFNHFMHGINKLISNRIPVRLKTMAIKSNFHEQREIAAFCLERTKDYYRFDPQLMLRYDRNPIRNKLIKTERLTPEQIVALEESDLARIDALRENCEILINENFIHFGCDHLFHCGAAIESFNVSYNGQFRLCPSLFAEGTTYDLIKGSLAEAWHEFVPKVRDMRSRRQEFLDTCRKCELVNLCHWCPAHAYLETGHLDGSTPYYCEVAHRRAESIKHVK